MALVVVLAAFHQQIHLQGQDACIGINEAADKSRRTRGLLPANTSPNGMVLPANWLINQKSFTANQ